MRSAQTEAFWRSFRRHQGINANHYQPTVFRTTPEVSDHLLASMAAGIMRAATTPQPLLGDGREEPMPAAGDYAVLLDRQRRPALIWRTTSVTVAPLSAVTPEYIWRSGHGTGQRDDWLNRLGNGFALQSKQYRFEMHPDIETVFETLDVVWPADVAQRTRLVAQQLDRAGALLQRVQEQQRLNAGIEAILSRIQTAVLTVDATMRIGITNRAAEVLLRRGDGLSAKTGMLTALRPEDHKSLLAAVAKVCGRREVDHRSGSQGAMIGIHRGEVQPPYCASIFPLRHEPAMRNLQPDAQAVVFIDDPEADPAPGQIGLWSACFRLTPAEARLAMHLASGESLRDAADVLGVTYNTVRAQMRAIFDKTDTHRQADLVRLLQRSTSLRVSLA